MAVRDCLFPRSVRGDRADRLGQTAGQARHTAHRRDQGIQRGGVVATGDRRFDSPLQAGCQVGDQPLSLGSQRDPDDAPIFAVISGDDARPGQAVHEGRGGRCGDAEQVGDFARL